MSVFISFTLSYFLKVWKLGVVYVHSLSWLDGIGGQCLGRSDLWASGVMGGSVSMDDSRIRGGLFHASAIAQAAKAFGFAIAAVGAIFGFLDITGIAEVGAKAAGFAALASFTIGVGGSDAGVVFARAEAIVEAAGAVGAVLVGACDAGVGGRIDHTTAFFPAVGTRLAGSLCGGVTIGTLRIFGTLSIRLADLAVEAMLVDKGNAGADVVDGA